MAKVKFEVGQIWYLSTMGTSLTIDSKRKTKDGVMFTVKIVGGPSLGIPADQMHKLIVWDNGGSLLLDPK